MKTLLPHDHRKTVYTNFEHCYVIFGYDIPCCSRVVIFDNFVVLVSRFYWCFFLNIALIDM